MESAILYRMHLCRCEIDGRQVCIQCNLFIPREQVVTRKVFPSTCIQISSTLTHICNFFSIIFTLTVHEVKERCALRISLFLFTFNHPILLRFSALLTVLTNEGCPLFLRNQTRSIFTLYIHIAPFLICTPSEGGASSNGDSGSCGGELNVNSTTIL